jgi:HD-like signal output (HDOD) protein
LLQWAVLDCMSAPSSTLLPAFTDAIKRRDFVVPAYPAAALRLRRLMASDNYGVPQISEAVSSDPALAATVLRLANSPLYRPDGPPITALGRAIHRIGVRSLSTVATASGVGAQACARGPLLDLKYAVWRRAVTCALICQKLGPARGLDSEEAFLAGLLHGFGRTVALACLEAVLGTSSPPRPLTPAEWMSMIDEHRGALAKAVAEQWELPSELAAAIGATSSNEASALASLLVVAEEFAHSIEQNHGEENASLNDRDKRLLRELCEVLPGAIAALVEAPQGNRPPPPSAIAKPATALKGQLRELALEATDIRARAGSALKSTAISSDGLRLKSGRPFQEATLVHLKVHRPEAPLTVWMSVVLSAPEASAFRVEVQLFAPSRELRSDWVGLFESGLAAQSAT